MTRRGFQVDYDVAIIGGGFSGSLTAAILAKQGRSVLLIDNGTLPRFAIGESSVPAGNMVLASLADQYDIPAVKPLAKYGLWKAQCSELACGLKRGFSYFFHSRNSEFNAGDDHANELLVAASSNDEVGDTHWFREDVDYFLVRIAQNSGVDVIDKTTVASLNRGDSKWYLALTSQSAITAKWIIDASGRQQVTTRLLSESDGQLQPPGQATGLLHTNTRAIYSHFENVGSWQDLMIASHQGSSEYPFNSDHSAQHHVLDEGWMWLLRFDHGITSAGIVMPGELAESEKPEAVWDSIIESYPSIQCLFRSASFAAKPGAILKSRRMQFLNYPQGVSGLVRLPSSFGFIDPLHSTGIAHNLIGIERTVHAFENHWAMGELDEEIEAHEKMQFDEFLISDYLIDLAYKCVASPTAFESATMLYFAAAIRYEENRSNCSAGSMGFLCAHEPFWKDALSKAHAKCATLNISDSIHAQEFLSYVQQVIDPYNTAGLCRPELRSMYAYTAAE